MPGVLNTEEVLRRMATIPTPMPERPPTEPMGFSVEETLARIGGLPPPPEPGRTNAPPSEFSVEDTLSALSSLPPASAPQMLPGTAAYTGGTRPVMPKSQAFGPGEWKPKRLEPQQEDIVGPGQAAAVAALTETPPTLAALKVGGMVGQRMPGPRAVKLGAGLVAGLGTAFAVSKAGRAVMPESWRETLTAIEEEHPWGTFLGGMASQMLALRPSVGTIRQAAQGLRLLPRAIAQRGGAQLTPAQAEAVFNVAFGSGTAAAMEGIRQFREGNFRPVQLAAAVVAGAALHKGWGPFGKLVGLTPKEARQVAQAATEATMTPEERLVQRGEELMRGRAAVQEEFAQRFEAELSDFMHQARQAEIQRRAGEAPPAEAPPAAEALPAAEAPVAEPPPTEPPPPPEPPMEPLFPTAPEAERPLYQTMERAPEELGYKGQEEAIAAEPAFRRERQSLGEIKERLKVEAPAYVDFVEAVERNAPVAELATKAEGLAPLSSAAQMLRFHREIYQSSSRGAAALLLKDFKSVVREGRFKGTSEAKTAVEQMIEGVGRTQDEGARRQLIDEAVRLAQPNIKWKLGDLFDSYRYFNMLTNPISHLRNVFGNTFNLYVAKPLELATTGHPVEAVRFVRDASRASADAWRNAIKAWSEFADSKYADIVEETGRPFEVAGRQNIPGRAVLELPTRALQTVDAVFSTMFKQAETTRLLRRGVSQATAEGMAERGAKNLFYMENLGGAVEDKSTLWAIRALDGMGKKFQEWGKDPNVGPVARMVFAFMRVSTNMAKANLQWSPFAQGITGRTMRTSVIADAIAKRDYGRPFMGAPKAARAAIMEEAGLVREQRVGRAMAGWMASAIGTIFAANGMTTGFPHDEKERQALYASGRLPGSVYIPGVNRWVPFYYFGPFMFSMAIPALAADEIRRAPIEDVSDAVDTFARVMKDGARIMGQMSTMTGAANVMKALAGEDDWSVQRAFGYLAGQFNPGSGAQRAVANWMDQRARKPQADWSNFWQQLITDIPGLSQYVGAYKTPTGEEAVRAPSGRYLPYAVGRPDEDYEALYQNRIAEMFQQAAKRKALGPKEERPKQVRQRR